MLFCFDHDCNFYLSFMEERFGSLRFLWSSDFKDVLTKKKNLIINSVLKGFVKPFKQPYFIAKTAIITNWWQAISRPLSYYLKNRSLSFRLSLMTLEAVDRCINEHIDAFMNVRVMTRQAYLMASCSCLSIIILIFKKFSAANHITLMKACHINVPKAMIILVLKCTNTKYHRRKVC